MFGCCDANQRLDKAPVPTKAGKSSLGPSSWCSMINFLRPCPLVRLIWAYHLQYLITRASCWTRQVTQEADTSFFFPRARLYCQGQWLSAVAYFEFRALRYMTTAKGTCDPLYLQFGHQNVFKSKNDEHKSCLEFLNLQLYYIAKFCKFKLFSQFVQHNILFC